MTYRCPFLQAVSEGRLGDAVDVATSGPEPAEPRVVLVLLDWAALMVAEGRAAP